MPVKLRMMPQTVPNRPTNGATEPTVARMFSRSDSGRSRSPPSRPSPSPAARACRRGRSRCRAVERRHSVTPGGEHPRDRQIAVACACGGRRRYPRPSRNRARTARSRAASCRAGSAKLKMIAQVQMLASSSPIITIFTTQSAWRNSAIGDSVAASVLKNRFDRRVFVPLAIRRCERVDPGVLAAASASRSARRTPPSPPLRPIIRSPRMTRLMNVDRSRRPRATSRLTTTSASSSRAGRTIADRRSATA